MITGMDRLRAAVTRSPCDRIPVFCNLLDQGARELGVPLREYYASGERVAEGQLRMRERFGYDNLWSLFYVGKEAELLGCRRILFAEDGPPNVGHLVIQRPEDIERFEVPSDLEGHPAFAEPARCLRILRSEDRGRHPICAYLTASMSLPAILMGMEAWLRLLLGGPAVLRDRLLEQCSRFFRLEAALYRRLGADVLLYSDPFASPDILPLRMIEELSLPWMARDLEGHGVADVVFYCGGASMNPVIEAVKARTGVGSFYLGPTDDLRQARARVGDDALLAGVINDIRLLDWTGPEIEAEVARILEGGGNRGGFLFGTLVMPYAIPEDRIRIMLDAAFRGGRLRSPAAGTP